MAVKELTTESAISNKTQGGSSMKLNQLALFADTPIETPLAAIEKQLDVYRKRAVSDGYRARCLPAWLQKQPDSVKRACWQLLAQRNPTSVRIANRLKIALAKEVTA